MKSQRNFYSFKDPLGRVIQFDDLYRYRHRNTMDFPNPHPVKQSTFARWKPNHYSTPFRLSQNGDLYVEISGLGSLPLNGKSRKSLIPSSSTASSTLRLDGKDIIPPMTYGNLRTTSQMLRSSPKPFTITTLRNLSLYNNPQKPQYTTYFDSLFSNSSI